MCMRYFVVQKYSNTMLRKIILLVFIISSSIFPQWMFEEGPGQTYIFDVQVYENKLYVVTDTVLFVKSDEIWKRISLNGHPAQSLYSVFVQNDIILLGTSNNGVFISRNAGETWSHFANGLPDNALTVSGFATLGDYLYISTVGGGVYRSTLSQLTAWTGYNEGMLSGLDFNINGIYAENGRIFISAGGNGYVYYRDHGADSWMPRFVASILPEITLFPEFVSVDGSLYVAGSAGLYKSPDRGETWVKVEGLNGSFNPLLIKAGGQVIYSPLKLTSTAMLYRIENGLTSPQPLFEAPVFADGNGVYYSGKIYQPTAAGLYSKMYDVTSGEPVVSPSQFQLSSVYPNPFNSTGTVNVSIELPGEYLFEVLLVTGQVLNSTTHFSEGKQYFQYRIDGKNLSSGTYFLRVSGLQESLLQKFIILK